MASLYDTCGDTMEQIAIISHHPVIINYMAADARWFFREGDGPARIENEPEHINDPLTPSELIARGWAG